MQVGWLVLRRSCPRPHAPGRQRRRMTAKRCNRWIERCVLGQGRSEKGSGICYLRVRNIGTVCGSRGSPVVLKSLTHTSGFSEGGPLPTASEFESKGYLSSENYTLGIAFHVLGTYPLLSSPIPSWKELNHLFDLIVDFTPPISHLHIAYSLTHAYDNPQNCAELGFRVSTDCRIEGGG